MSLQELRSLFVSILRSAYEKQARDGELDDREALAIALNSSLDFADDAIQKGEPFCDWTYLNTFHRSSLLLTTFGKLAHRDVTYSVHRIGIETCLAFMAAHRWAQSFMQKEFADANCELSELGKIVFHESREEYLQAEEELNGYPADVVRTVVSHKFCLILLNSGVKYV